VFVYVYNDHATTFFFDLYPTFALGVSDSYPIADEGMGPRKVPPIRGHASLSRWIAHSLVNDEFDMTVFQELALDHGCNSPMTMLFPQSVKENAWPVAMVPLAVNVLQHPVPTPMRCWKLGRALRKAILSYPEDLKVVVCGTGGLSHQMNGERAGFNDTDWDEEFLDLIHRDPGKLASMKLVDYAKRGGTEGAEEIMWLAMRGALSEQVKKVHSAYYLAMTTTMAVELLEEPA
jgi:protocatechuate 4,5-dioxygenase beta chain